jgi:hypothetical protein
VGCPLPGFGSPTRRLQSQGGPERCGTESAPTKRPSSGRVNQKARTRDALIAAARELLGRGITPTIERAAAEASVSRTPPIATSPTKRPCWSPPIPPSRNGRCSGRNHHRTRGRASRSWPRTRPAGSSHTSRRCEPCYGSRCRASDPRSSRCTGGCALAGSSWIEEALSPLRDRLGPNGLRRLVYGIAATLGIEAFCSNAPVLLASAVIRLN